MHACVCVCVCTHECAGEMAGAGGGSVAVRNSMFSHEWHYRNQR